jgi:hypothetical protein
VSAALSGRVTKVDAPAAAASHWLKNKLRELHFSPEQSSREPLIYDVEELQRASYNEEIVLLELLEGADPSPSLKINI